MGKGTTGYDLYRLAGAPAKLILLLRQAYVRIATAVGQPVRVARTARADPWDNDAAVGLVTAAAFGSEQEAVIVAQARRRVATELRAAGAAAGGAGRAGSAGAAPASTRKAYADGIAWALRRLDGALRAAASPANVRGPLAGAGPSRARAVTAARDHVLAVTQAPRGGYHQDAWVEVEDWLRRLVVGRFDLGVPGWQSLPLTGEDEAGLGIFATRNTTGGSSEGLDIVATGVFHGALPSYDDPRSAGFYMAVPYTCRKRGRTGRKAVSMLMTGSAMMVSHSCAANATLQALESDHTESHGRRATVRLNADTEVKAGEEVTVDYGWPPTRWRKRCGGCGCGASKCIAPAP